MSRDGVLVCIGELGIFTATLFRPAAVVVRRRLRYHSQCEFQSIYHVPVTPSSSIFDTQKWMFFDGRPGRPC